MVLLLTAARGAAAQNRENTISVTFKVDDKTVACDDLKVELRVDRRLIPVQTTDHGFIVPDLFGKLYVSPRNRRKNNVDIDLSCGEYKFEFPGEYPARLQPGVWKLGIAYPPFRNDELGGVSQFQQGAWISYVIWECNKCEPALVTTLSHSDPPNSIVEGFRKEQSNASGESARDIAYALAVFKVEYDSNRDHLLSLLNGCLTKPKNSPEDVCDSNLGAYLINLYWRGDNGLLVPLLQVADSEDEAVESDGYFYSDLLERRTSEVLSALGALPVEKQKEVCKLAGKDDLSMNSPKEERVAKQLRAAGGEVAERCLQEAEKAANEVPWRQNKK